jgi:phosphoglycolate phosphatase
MKGFSKYSHIIWDWNGTLLNDAWLCVEVMNGMLLKRHLPLLTKEKYRAVFNFPVRDYYLQLGFDFDHEPFEEVGMEFMNLYNERQKECSLHEEVPEILHYFSEKGYVQNILSAREQNELVAETRDLAVFRFFERIYGLDDHYAHGKTDVGIRLLKEMGVDPRKIIFIGDTCHDAEVAQEIGLDCLLIPNGHHSEERLRRMNRPMVSSLSDLKTGP